MDRDMRRGLFVAIASGVAAVALVTAGRGTGAPPAPATDGTHVRAWEEIDRPPMRVVAQESQLRGWPHVPNAREARAVAYSVARQEIVASAGQSGAVLCRATRGTMGFWVCGVRVFDPHFDADGRTFSYRVVVRVWEDGSWRSSYPGGAR